MITIDNLAKSYGNQILFEGAAFQINARERVGLVGRNGHGKTTLFRIIVGDELPDAGTVTLPRNYHIAYVRQELDFTEDTVLAEGKKGLPESERHQQWKVEKILAGLGFSPPDMRRHPGEFSGGYQVRLNLAKALLSESDLLLLDEPTNYLDITSIRWIEDYLINWPHELILITHDRSFMDRVVTHTMGIHRTRIRKITGNTEKYYTQVALDEEMYEKTRLNDERRQKEVDQFIRRFRAKARLANLVQSRIKLLEKMGKKEKLEKVKSLEFSFRSKPFQAKYAMKVQNLSFAYNPEVPLITQLTMTIKPQDRVCVIGKNGKGKTTLLKLLAGILAPTGGRVTCSPTISKGLFEQTNISSLVASRTVLDEIGFAHPDVDKQTAWNICGAMMFEGEHALKKISVLSGGEKSRVMLGKLLATPLNLLLLDEVTNHLDMESCDALLAALDNFDGSLIMVTHNEMFLHALAERLIVFQKDRAYLFEGSYQRFLERDGWAEEGGAQNSGATPLALKADADRHPKKEKRRQRARLIAERAKVLNPLSGRIEQIEKAIVCKENHLKKLAPEMEKAAQLNSSMKITALSQEMHTCRLEIDRLFDELEQLTAVFEAREREFNNQLQET